MHNKKKPGLSGGLTRRSFIKGVGGALGGAALRPALLAAQEQEAASAAAAPGLKRFPAEGTDIVLRVNGADHRVRVKPSTTLLSVLREQLDLTGSKEVCDRGACGACTVLLNERALNSCMVLAVDAVGADIRTIEGLAEGGALHPIQKAFVQHDACQCGYCIPGFVMRTHALLRENPAPTPAEIKKGLAGNLCRCACYPKIFEAVQSVGKI